MILAINITIWVILAAALTITAMVSIYFLNQEKDLKQFRENLRVGDLCRVRIKDGSIIRARIVCRNSAISFVAIDIDSRQRRITSVTQILRP